MHAETSTGKFNSRVAYGLLVGLAVCCSVMYLTTDAGDEYIHEVVKGDGDDVTGAEYDAGTSVGAVDVLKAGQIYTNTPNGNMRLMDYFVAVEKEITSEVSKRKQDIDAVRAEMARDLAFNTAARASLKKDMLKKMAENAKLARDNLDREMRKTQEHFAKSKALAERRQRAMDKRDASSEKLIKQNKKRAAKQLKLSVSAWQKSTNAWAAHTNAHIDQMNKHAAANAAQIKENAKKARQDLSSAMHQWDQKVAGFRTESATSRNKLSEQFKAQDKATRAWANNNIKSLVASTAAQFNDVETKMAKNRHEVDMALKHATQKFAASLNAASALEDKHYAENVANIAAAKAEAKAKVDAATAQFKVGLLSLSSTVKEQVAKVNNRIDDAAGVVRADAAAQAKVNANVNAEMSRMVKLGNKRYQEHLKDDAELQDIIAKDKAANDDKMNKMALNFNQKLNDVRKTLAKDRKSAEDALQKKTSAVYEALKKQEEGQAAKNLKMEEATTRMRLDQMHAIREAKAAFQEKIHALGKVVAENDKKADSKVKKLTGVVGEEAVKSANGRAALKAMEEANKSEMHSAVQAAIMKGKKSAQAVEDEGKKMDDATKFQINSKLNAEIAKLRDETNAGVEKLALQSKEARDEMKKEMLFAIRSAADIAAKELQAFVQDGKKSMAEFREKSKTIKDSDTKAREDLEQQIADNAQRVARQIKDAVKADARAQNALQSAVAKKIKKTNTDIDAYADQMKEQAKATRLEIAKAKDDILGKVKAEQNRAKAAVETFASEDAAAQKKVLDFLSDQLKKGAEEADEKFGQAREKLAEDRAHVDEMLGSGIVMLNDALAKQAALNTRQFQKTVKDLGAAKKQVMEEVVQLRKEMTTAVLRSTSTLKKVETKLSNSISTVSADVADLKAEQLAINRHVDAEMKRVVTLSNDRFSKSKKARGQLRKIMDENKAAAAAEVKALAEKTETKVKKLRSNWAATKRQMAKDTSDATEKFTGKLAEQAVADQKATEEINAQTEGAALAAANALKRANEMFVTKTTSLANTVTANAKQAEDGIAELTGVVHDYAQAAAGDRELIKEQSKMLQDDLNKALSRAISEGEAKAKAAQQRIAAHLEETKNALNVELIEQTEAAADNVLKILEGNRQKIADNYLSLKAYAASVADDVTDQVAKGKGRALSSIGDLLVTVGSLADVRPSMAEGAGMGLDSIPAVFSGGEVKVSKAVGAINGLVNEYTKACNDVRSRYQFGIGKYLMDRLMVSMQDKGVLQVDKVEGKAGNWVYVNGRSVGLSNKLSDFQSLAASMSVYESMLAKLTTKLSPKKHTKAAAMVQTNAKEVDWEGPGTWDGN